MPIGQHEAIYGGGNRILRRLGSIAGAALVSAILLGSVASSASAEPVGFFLSGAKSEEMAKQPKFEAEKYTATVKTKALTAFQFIAKAGKLKCNEFQLTGSIAGAASELKFQPFFWPCTFIGFPATVTANGCEFALHALNAGPPYVGTTDVLCPAGKALEFTAFSSGPICTLKILPQKGVEGVSFENTGTGSARAVTVNFNLTTMSYSQEGIGAPCTAGEFSNGLFTAGGSLFATK